MHMISGGTVILRLGYCIKMTTASRGFLATSRLSCVLLAYGTGSSRPIAYYTVCLFIYLI